MQELLILGQRRNGQDLQVPSLLAAAHVRGERVRCLCSAARPEMYVSRTRMGFTVKRLPYSGEVHAIGCVSFGGVISRKRTTHREPIDRRLAEASESTLKGMRDLWERAGLTHWRPTFQGKRPWAVVRSRLLGAAAAGGTNDSVATCLYIPEQFQIARAEAIASRRRALWKSFASQGTSATRLQVIGELKRIHPDAEGATLTIRHIPDLSFRIGRPEARVLQLRFVTQLLQWRRENYIRLILAGILDMSNEPAPSICSPALLAVDTRWVPVT